MACYIVKLATVRIFLPTAELVELKVMVTRNRTALRGKLLKAYAMVLNEGAKILALQYELFYAV